MLSHKKVYQHTNTTFKDYIANTVFLDSVFPLSDYAARHSWDRLVKRAGIKNLRFHDLRHEAISRFFEMGLSMPEVALISGHKDPRMLFRYTHLRATDILKHAAFTGD